MDVKSIKNVRNETLRKVRDGLTNEESAVLYLWMKFVYGIRLTGVGCSSPSKFRKNALFGGAHRNTILMFVSQLLGDTHPEALFFEVDAEECGVIQNSMTALKEELLASKYREEAQTTFKLRDINGNTYVPSATTIPPKLDVGSLKRCVVAWNKHTGYSFATRHVLERFQEHAGVEYESAEDFLVRFKGIFRSSRLSNIRKRYHLERIIRNGFEKAVYLYHKGLDLRFVVSEDRERILTVERPK